LCFEKAQLEKKNEAHVIEKDNQACNEFNKTSNKKIGMFDYCD